MEDNQNTSQKHPVGIDLGTTESVLAFVDKTGKVRPWKRKGASALHASAVLIDSRLHIGDDAVKFATEKNILIEGFKRDMGKERVRTNVKSLKVPPEVLSGFVLEHLKSRAESELGAIKDVVISVPAYFDAKRRLATKDAGRLAGLNVVAIINEPTAASIGYCYHKGYFSTAGENQSQNLLVYDFGGGTFDATLLRYENDQFQTLATDGDVRLGGIDLDERLAEYLSEKFYEKFQIDTKSVPRKFKELVTIANEVKHGLSESDEWLVQLSFFGKQTSELILREEFNGLIEPFIERTITTCEDLLYSADNLSWKEIDTILLVGGSSQIPFVSDKLESLTGIQPSVIGNPQELVAEGCALYAANLSESHSLNFRISNVNSHSLGIRGRDMQTSKPFNRILVPRNTTLPVTVKKDFVTYKSGQGSVKMVLLEGENENPELCYQVGDFRVELGPNVKKGEVIRVYCTYNDDGTIQVTAKRQSDGTKGTLEILKNRAQIDPLVKWRRRLTNFRADQNNQSEFVLFDETFYDSDSLVAAIQELSELDGIYLQLGKAARRTSLPDSLANQQQFARSLEKKIAQIRELIEELNMELANQRSTDAEELGKTVENLRELEQQNRQALRHVLISLGRCCHQMGIETTHIDVSPQRIEYLEKSICEIWA